MRRCAAKCTTTTTAATKRAEERTNVLVCDDDDDDGARRKQGIVLLSYQVVQLNFCAPLRRRLMYNNTGHRHTGAAHASAYSTETIISRDRRTAAVVRVLERKHTRARRS